MSASAPQAPPLRGSGPFLRTAPELSLPLRHFAFAAAAFWLFSAAFLWGQDRFLGWDFQARWVLGLVHLLTLGWVTMTMLGAMLQMATVLWEVPLAAPPGVVAGAWALLAAGIAGFVGLLWAGSDRYWLPAALAATAVAAYLVILARTMLRAKRLDWTGTHLAWSAGWLAVLATLGVLMAYDRERAVVLSDPTGTLLVHMHLALVGWVTLTIYGVSYRVVSMFALSHLESKTPGRAALWLTNAGLVGLAVDGLLAGRRLVPLWACLMAAGFAAYALQMRRLFAARNRRIDPALAFTLLALAGGALWASLGLALAFGLVPPDTHVFAAYVWTALLGWITPYILGQIHKIVPFLVWLHVYSPREWRPPLAIPKIGDLTDARLAWAEWALMAAAVPLGAAGFLRESPALLHAAAWALFGAATLYLVNTAGTLRHVFRRDPRWATPNA